jgi:hypothetical protein
MRKHALMMFYIECCYFFEKLALEMIPAASRLSGFPASVEKHPVMYR